MNYYGSTAVTLKGQYPLPQAPEAFKWVRGIGILLYGTSGLQENYHFSIDHFSFFIYHFIFHFSTLGHNEHFAILYDLVNALFVFCK